MSNQELQEEEREVLQSIYDGDSSFKELNPTTYQYKYGVNEDSKSFLLEISWGSDYPSEKPTINMDTFYNKHLVSDVKEKVLSLLNTEIEMYLGAAMTYTLFEFVKEKFDEIMECQPQQVNSSEISMKVDNISLTDNQEEVSKKAPKKEQLSKAQKRKQWDRVDNKGDRPRGWDWVDVVKHLSQTGPKESPETLTTPTTIS